MAKLARQPTETRGTGKRRRPRARITALASAVLALAGAAPVAATTMRGSSLLTFPLVLVDGGRDTVIELTNITNLLQYVQCFYVDGALSNPALPPGPLNPPLCTQSTFTLKLTRQQPTFWVASQGRPVRGRDALTGIDPGTVPALPPGFTGYLRCVVLDASGAPIATNALIGSASLRDTSGLDISRYAAIGQQAGGATNTDATLCLGSATTGPCAGADEYDSCAMYSRFEHFAAGGEDPLAGAGSAVDGEFVFIPCSHDHASGTPSTTAALLLVTNPFEEILSAQFPVTCWARRPLADLFIYSPAVLGAEYVQTSVQAPTMGAGLMVLGESRHQIGAAAARAAIDARSSGARATADVIVLPGGF